MQIKIKANRNASGKRKRGRPKETWRRSVEKEIKDQGATWGMVQQMSADRQKWRNRSPWRRPYVSRQGED